ncbi:hypothetical protein L6164_035040 [Bauhinia variegata]|uniref:Uncharacterized protein n=1 Tax=Bauhinia variegata TaxID=167791 RepID=A0ACB9KWK4_BAUVA|nr:hypothetical protein L6164_035040 [Bauhinia variegata]
MACSGLQALREGRKIHGLVWKLGMQSDLCIESALMNFYSKCGSLEAAWQFFESAEELGEVSLTVIHVAFAQNGFEEEAIHIFLRMVKSGIEIDPHMVSAILGVFGVDISLGPGTQIHSLIIKKNLIQNPFVSNGLINKHVFEVWRSEGLTPSLLSDDSEECNLSELHDCSFYSPWGCHAGLVEKGMEVSESMTRDHKISPRLEHYTSVVDMLGGQGQAS